MLTDNEILKNMQRSEITIKPFNAKNLGANSYDLTIGGRIRSLKFNCAFIDLKKDNQYTLLDTNLPYDLSPHETIIFTSKEIIGCRRKTLGILSARSNLSRTGLIFQFSDLVDTGFCGILSGTIYNATHSVIKIPENLRVMQIMFNYAYGELDTPYNKRAWSKNTNQFSLEKIKYKVDKEFLKT